MYKYFFSQLAGKDEFCVIEAGVYDSVSKHCHDFIEAVFVDSGEGLHILNGKQISVKQGDFFIVPISAVHSIIPVFGKKELSLVNIIFMPESFCYDFLKLKKDAVYSEKDIPMLPLIIERLKSERYSQDKYKKEIVRNLIGYILACVFRADKKRKTKNCAEGAFDVEKIKKYIFEHFADDLSLENIAQGCFVSVTHLQKAFKEQAGVSVKQYCASMRITNACRMLLSSKLSVNKIAEKCGFNDLKNFYRQFKSMVGKTPAEFRKIIDFN